MESSIVENAKHLIFDPVAFSSPAQSNPMWAIPGSEVVRGNGPDLLTAPWSLSPKDPDEEEEDVDEEDWDEDEDDYDEDEDEDWDEDEDEDEEDEDEDWDEDEEDEEDSDEEDEDE